MGTALADPGIMQTLGQWEVPLGGGNGWCQVPVAMEPQEYSTEAVTRATCCPQDLEKPTAIAYRMKGGGQPGGGSSSGTEDTLRRPPEPKPKPSQCLPLGWLQGWAGLGPLTGLQAPSCARHHRCGWGDRVERLVGNPPRLHCSCPPVRSLGPSSTGPGCLHAGSAASLHPQAGCAAGE